MRQFDHVSFASSVATARIFGSGWVGRTVQAVLVAVFTLAFTAYFSWRIKRDPMLTELALGTASLLLAGCVVLGVPWLVVFVRAYLKLAIVELQISRCHRFIADGVWIRYEMVDAAKRQNEDAWYDALRKFSAWHNRRDSLSSDIAYKYLVCRDTMGQMNPGVALKWPGHDQEMESIRKLDDFLTQLDMASSLSREYAKASLRKKAG